VTDKKAEVTDRAGKVTDRTREVMDRKPNVVDTHGVTGRRVEVVDTVRCDG